MTRPDVLFFEPLFEEANRTRRLIADIRRDLATQGIDSDIAEPPGTGESLTPVSAVRLDDWLDHAAAMERHVVIASLRGGALIDHAARGKGYWRFAPETGARIVRDLERTRLANGDGSALYAGHALSDGMIEALRAAVPQPVSPVRIVRLESDAGEADAKVPGSPLWRRAEPGEDRALATGLADDLAQWVRQCAG